MRHHLTRWGLKLIGIILFASIVATIDWRAIAGHLALAKPLPLAFSFGLVFVIYALRAARWHALLWHAGIPSPPRASWEVYNAGIFLGQITPGKIGELGKAAYLRKEGVPLRTALALSLVERLADLILAPLLGILALAVLFGTGWAALALGGMLTAAAATYPVLLRAGARFTAASPSLRSLMTVKNIAWIAVLTVGSWSLYITWAVLIARSIGIGMPALPLAAVFVLAAMISMLPVAPSGLGTRDAALIALLAPFGIAAERAVALAFLMFASIVLSSALGGWYWLRCPHRFRPTAS